jgi:hypothetical protein
MEYTDAWHMATTLGWDTALKPDAARLIRLPSCGRPMVCPI